MNKELNAERHDNISLLSELLEATTTYDGLVATCDEKANDVANLKRKIAQPKPPRFKKRQIPLILILGILTFGIAFLICLIMVLIHNKKWKKYIAELQAQLVVAQQAYADACAARDKYDAEVLTPYLEALDKDRFPIAYARWSYAIAYMRDLLINLRAYTMCEAINLFEECMHRARLENALDTVIGTQNAIVTNTARTAFASERAAAAQEATAVAAAATAAATASIAASQKKMAREMEATGRHIRSNY